jgi:hypothetical protein
VVSGVSLEVSLAGKLAGGPLPAMEALRIAAAIAQEVKRVHEFGGVAGDLDPERVGIGGALASLETARGGEAASAYAAPERWQGQEPDARSDIYSFGALLYHMINGQPPFRGATGEDLRRAVERDAPAAMALPATPGEPPAVREGLTRLASACLAKAPEHRCQRMQKVVMELKLLAVAARQTESVAAARRERADSLRAEIVVLGTSLAARMGSLESRLEDLHRRVDVLSVGARDASRETGALAQQVAAQKASLDSLEIIIKQTDDLMERLVEAFDSVQSSMLAPSDPRV